MFGPTQPIILQMLGSERSRDALEGVAMELEDSLFPLLRQVTIGVDPVAVFDNADWALLIGAKPRGPGMERKDLLDVNGSLFATQGLALNESAHRDCKVVVVGNPCNTNALSARRGGGGGGGAAPRRRRSLRARALTRGPAPCPSPFAQSRPATRPAWTRATSRRSPGWTRTGPSASWR